MYMTWYRLLIAGKLGGGRPRNEAGARVKSEPGGVGVERAEKKKRTK